MIGSTISHYRILEKLGGGGMGVVYKAEDTRLKRIVALKFLPPTLITDSEAKERFIHEAQAASALDHPNICNVHDIGETDDGQIFIVMAYYEGETLKKKIEDGSLKIEDGIDIGIQIAHGLARAHAAGIVHRDIKPANVMVTSEGVAKVVDFGLAKLTDRTLLTVAGSMLGTAAYMSPEQARGEGADCRTDIWSLGVTFYEMLTGHRPFESDYEQALVYSILNEDPRPMRELRSDVPEALEKIVRRAMAKRVEDRYQTADEFLSDLSSYQAGTGLSRQTRRVATGRRKRLFAVLGAALIVIVPLLAVVFSGKSEVIDTVAVLPFANVTKDPNLEWMCDGLTSEVIGNLCQTPGFSKVIAFSSVMEFKNREVTPAEVRRKLGVVAVLVTRLYQHGDEVSVSTELLDAREQTRLWGKEFSQKASEIRTLPREIVSAVRKALNLAGRGTAPGTVIQRTTDNPDAYRLFLQGQVSYHRVTEEGLRKAIECYRMALQLDPRFASAYAGISLAYFQLKNLNLVPWEEAADSMRLASTQALAIDGNNAEAHLAIGMFRYDNYERGAAEQELKSAIASNPLCADAIHDYAHLLSEDARHEEAIRLMRQSTELEPLSAHYQYCLATAYWSARRWDDALHESDKVKEIDSTFYRNDAQLSIIYFYKGMYQKAIECMQQFALHEESPMRFDLLRAKIYAATGKGRECRLQLDRLYRVVKGKRPDPAEIAAIHSLLGNRDSALVWLERAYRERSNGIPYVKVKPEFDSLRGNPRFKQLLARVGFTD